jgi:hypothetical protein
VRVATLVLIALSAAACTQSERRPAGGLLPQSFAPYGIEFTRYTAPEFPLALRATGVATGYSVIAVTVEPTAASPMPSASKPATRRSSTPCWP